MFDRAVEIAFVLGHLAVFVVPVVACLVLGVHLLRSRLPN